MEHIVFQNVMIVVHHHQEICVEMVIALIQMTMEIIISVFAMLDGNRVKYHRHAMLISMNAVAHSHIVQNHLQLLVLILWDHTHVDHAQLGTLAMAITVLTSMNVN